jgi:hypothetical protein
MTWTLHHLIPLIGVVVNVVALVVVIRLMKGLPW